MLKGTSVHWHGITQHRHAEMDGVAFVTQCPISTGHSFTYKFPTSGQAGTYWYHSHYSQQYCDGFRGPLVIYDPNDPLRSMYDVDDANTVVTIAEWYHSYGPVLSTQSGALAPNTTLINGLGRNENSTSAPLSVIRLNMESDIACDSSAWPVNLTI